MILVTGGTGFVGSLLVRELKKDNDVTLLSRKPGPDTLVGDISDYGVVSKAAKGADVIFHLAAELDQFAAYDRHQRITVGGTENVMKAAEKNGSKVVYMRSNAVTNLHKTNYSIAKVSAEAVAASYWGKLTVPIIRTSLIYDRELMMRLKKVSYLPFPWKRQAVHLAYRPSVVRALIGAMERGKSEVYNVADKSPVLLTDLFKELARPRPMLWMPPQAIWLGIAATYPIEWISAALRIRPIATPSYIKSIFEQRALDTKNSVKTLKYLPVDTLETVKALIS